jgi:hypothetical protein
VFIDRFWPLLGTLWAHWTHNQTQGGKQNKSVDLRIMSRTRPVDSKWNQ